MPEITHAQKFKRTFTIGRETDDKKSRPHFMEWVKEIPDPKPSGAKYRTKHGEKGQKHYRLWQGWSGHLIDLRREVKSYGANDEDVLLATLQDDSGDVVIELSFFNSYAGDLMRRLLDEGYKPEQSLSLSPYAMDRPNGGQNVGISAINGADYKMAANARAFGDKPAAKHLVGMPDLEPVTVRGVTTYDCTQQHLWLFAQLESKVVPKLSKLGGASNTPATRQADQSLNEPPFPANDLTNYENNAPDDSLPF